MKTFSHPLTPFPPSSYNTLHFPGILPPEVSRASSERLDSVFARAAIDDTSETVPLSTDQSTCMHSERPWVCALCKRHFPWLRNYSGMRCHSCETMVDFVSRAMCLVASRTKPPDSDSESDDGPTPRRDHDEQFFFDYASEMNDPCQFIKPWQDYDDSD